MRTENEEVRLENGARGYQNVCGLLELKKGV